jgi:hypothetical protein
MHRKAWIVAILLFLLVSPSAVWYATMNLHRRSGESPRPAAIPGSALSKETKLDSQVAGTHIEGCEAFILPGPGEPLEPRLLPEASIEDLRHLYGQETKHVDEIGEWEWQSSGFNLQGWEQGKARTVRSIGLDAKPGHIIATPDGIKLGKDTFATLLLKMKRRGITVRERMEGADGTWILFASFPSTCNPDDWSEYSWYSEGTPAVEKAIGNSIPFRSDVFLHKIVENYATGTGRESDGDSEGQPATHQ